MRVGYKKFGAAGAVAGFMLTMGGFVVYWVVEYIQIQRAVTQLCETEGGITVYVTPEEWRKQVGEKEWINLKPLTSSAIRKMKVEVKKVTYRNNVYKYSRGIYRSGNIENKRIKIFNNYKSPIPYTTVNSSILIDIDTRRTLIDANYINTGVGSISNNFDGFKFWMSSLPKCPKKFYYQFHKLARQYSNIGETNE